MIQAALMGMPYGATVEEVADTFHTYVTYLTMAEALKSADQGFDRDVGHHSCCV